jgi:hypothetical protein
VFAAGSRRILASWPRAVFVASRVSPQPGPVPEASWPRGRERCTVWVRHMVAHLDNLQPRATQTPLLRMVRPFTHPPTPQLANSPPPPHPFLVARLITQLGIVECWPSNIHVIDRSICHVLLPGAGATVAIVAHARDRSARPLSCITAWRRINGRHRCTCP